MVALAATDVTITDSARNKDFAHRGMTKNMSVFDLTFGDGALTYPSGGIPLPVIAKFGYSREITFMGIEQPYGNGFVYKFDRTNHKLLIYTMGVVTTTTGASVIEAVTSQYYLENSVAGLSSSLMLAGASGADTTFDLGPLIQLPTGLAPAAATVRILTVGE